jgi:uncharacterized protein YndB with AHSA1/START domain
VPASDGAVNVTVDVAASPATVFRCIVESDLLSEWLAAKASIEPRVGGAVRIDFERYRTVVTGRVVEIVPGERVAFTWGVASGPDAASMPAASTRVTISIAATPGGSRVTLQHEGLPTESSRRDHEFGWRGYLGQLAQVAPRAQRAGGFDALVDSYLAAWAETDAAARGALLGGSFAESGRFVDVHADVSGRAALDAHLAACQRMFPGVRMVRDGAVMRSRDALLVRWRAVLPSGQQAAAGTNFLQLGPGGEIATVRGFWDPPQA